MPGLPEVETTCQGIKDIITAQSINRVIVRQRKLRHLIPDTFEQNIEGRVCHQVSRRAKYVILHLDQGYVLIHLGMSGCLPLC